jgi:cell division protein FtsL
VRALPDHVLLDRIIRGRVWIPLLGVLLAGIVAMQVEVLKLNAGIGRSLERSSSLQGQNELLRASVARLSDEQRIERIAAAQMGMVMPAPTQLRFVHSGARSVERALGSIHAPDGTNFIAHLPTIGAPAAAQGTSVNTSVGLTPTGTSSSTSSTAGGGVSGTTVSSGANSATTAASGTPSATGTTSSTSGSGDTASTGASGTTSATGAATPTGTTTSAGTTDQSATSSSGGAGAVPVGG